MSDFLLCNDLTINIDSIIDTINPAGTFITKNIKSDDVQIFTAHLPKSPLKGDLFYEDEIWVAVFSGDLIGKEKVDFCFFIRCMESGNFNSLTEIEGLFTFAAYNKKTKKYYLISDFRSQYPVFYYIQNEKIFFSTSLSSLVRILEKIEFNKDWLYDYLYFNFPINNQTFLKNVFRMPAGSVLEIDSAHSKKNIYNYYPAYKVSGNLLKEKEALDYAKQVCNERFPLYYYGAEIAACALTGGWDGRTCLALAPDYKKITAYTYGIAGSSDLFYSEKTARKTGINHLKIHFDEKFIDELPSYIYETVFISSGLQNIFRSTLLYVYKYLGNHSSPFPVTLSGIGLDLIFRGHLGLRVGVSKDMEKINRTGVIDFNDTFWSKVLKEDYTGFKNFILNGLEQVKKNYGDYKDPGHHLLYAVYQSSKEHFSGELKLANNFTTLRVPGWDSKIVELAFLIDKGCLSYSELTGYPREGREAMEVQAYLLSELAPKFAKIPVMYAASPNTILKGNFSYSSSKNFNRLKHKLKKTLSGNYAKLEDWDQWINYTHRTFIDNLLSNKNSLIKSYISEKYLQELLSTRDPLMLKKIITIEIILKLIDNRWKRFWNWEK